MADARYWVWFALRMKAGDPANELLEAFSSPEKVYMASRSELERMERLPKKMLDRLMDKSMEETERVLSVCRTKGIRVITYRDADYPSPLRAIPDPPLVLYAIGSMPDFGKILPIAIVGTRRASFYGMHLAQNLGNRLAMAGAYVVTGMAAGIDASANRGAMKTGMPGCVVLGTAIDTVYPRSSEDVYTWMRSNGLILSEYPPGSETHSYHFPERNRIVSGLSRGVVLVEAPMRSGSLITARLALEQGKEVFAVPGNIDAPSFEGSNRLLVAGEARAIMSVRDILEEYEWQYTRYTTEEEAEKLLHIESAGIPSGKASEETAPADEKDEKIMEALAGKALSAEELTAVTAIPAGELFTRLTMLEINGKIKADGGRYYRVC